MIDISILIFFEKEWGISMSGLWDTHMHSQFSGDSRAPQESMITSAITKGLDGICFTDHLDIDYPEEPDLFLLDLPNYSASVHALQEQYKDRLSIRFGIELGLQPHLAAIHSDILKQYPFDFVIGSSHVVHGRDPYYAPYWADRTEEDGCMEYFSSILENIRAFDDFDVYGHLDYVVRYSPSRGVSYDYTQYADLIDEILKLLIQKGKGIEINTAGFKYGLSHPNPTEGIIARYRELGGELVTIGADAHAPEHVAYDFQKVSDILKSAGFSYYTVFSDRKPEMKKL